MINIYELKYFELLSEKRNRSFRFALYDGSNYQELVDYIHGASPNTSVWEESLLQKNKYYSYSGRDFSFMEIHEWDLRPCIASNPFLIQGKDRNPIYMSYEEAVSYLKQTPYHRVFPYESIADTFAYDPNINNFVVYNSNHHRGLSVNELPKYAEWYIVNDDKLHLLFEYIEPKYVFASHQVHFDFGLRQKADTIIDLIFEINQISFLSADKKCVFNATWEDTKRYRTLYHTCLHEHQFKAFVSVLYNYIFEETKGSNNDGFKVNRELLPQTFRHDDFVLHVSEFRNFYSHGQGEYETSYLSGADLFNFYINSPFPRTEADFETLQTKLLDGFISFLNKLKEYLTFNSIVEGTICLDDDDNVHCSNVLLPKEYAVWGGYKCSIKHKVKNEIHNLKGLYPFYSRFPLIFVSIKGYINIESQDDYFLNDYKLGNGLSPFIGCIATIESLSIISDKNSSDEPTINYLPTSIKVYNTSDNPIDFPELFHHSKELVVSDEIKNKLEDANLAGIVSIKLINIKGSWIINKIEDGLSPTRKGFIERDAAGFYHVGNVALSPSFAIRFVGKECIVEKFIPSKTGSAYPFFSSKIKVI